jgi:hypothetical protein
LIALVLAWALAQECEVDVSPPEEAVSVAWVRPVGDRARAGEWLWVVPTSELSRWLDRASRPTVGGLLRHLGLRRREREPRRRYMVVVFDARREVLCRPIEGEAPGAVVGGVATCEAAQSRATRAHDGCGRSVDADGGRGATWYRARWEDLAAHGFCVLPAPRFVEEAGR